MGKEGEEEEGCSKEKESMGALEWDEGKNWRETKGGDWERLEENEYWGVSSSQSSSQLGK